MTVPDVVKSRTLRVGQRVVRAMRIIVDDLPQGIVCSGNVTARHQVNFPQRPRCELHMEGLWQDLDARLLEPSLVAPMSEVRDGRRLSVAGRR